MNNITAVILAAGLGTRMKTSLPKVMHPVGSGTILERIINSLNESGISDIVAVIGYKAEIIENSFKNRIRFVRQKELRGSGDALSQALSSLEGKDNVLVTCGDTPLIEDNTYRRLIERHIDENASCTILTCSMTDPFSYGRIVRNQKGNVRGVVEEKDATCEERKINEINVGTYCFRRDHLTEFIKNIKLNEHKKEFYLTDIVDIFEKNNKKIVTQDCRADEAVGVNSRKDLAVVNNILNKKTLNKLMETGVTIIDPETTYIDESAVIERDVVIFPNTVIESDVKIMKNCRIGPFARIRPGTRLLEAVEIGNFVEICRTEIGQGTRVKHHTYLGDTIVGREVNIGAGVITANYDGEEKCRTIIEDNVFVGVGVIFIAPVRIGKNAKIGAGSVVTKHKDVSPGETVVGIPARPFKKG